MTGLLLLLVFGFGALAWWQLLQGKERARRAALAACREHGLLLMDDTVVLEAVQLRNAEAHSAFGLRYRFDFAHEGIPRTGSSVLIRPGRPATVIIATSSGQLIEEV